MFYRFFFKLVIIMKVVSNFFNTANIWRHQFSVFRLQRDLMALENVVRRFLVMTSLTLRRTFSQLNFSSQEIEKLPLAEIYYVY